MNAVSEKQSIPTFQTTKTGKPSTKSLKIAICPPEFTPMQQAMRGEPADATYLLQRHIATGLSARNHQLTFIAQRTLGENVCTTDLQNPTIASLTWSNNFWFNSTRKGIWRIQQLLKIPYLNVFTNYRLFDACMKCLPGHDIVYERNGLYRAGVAMACRRLKLPYVLFVEADEIMELDFLGRPITGILRWRAKKLFQYNLQAANCIICVSKPLKHHLVTEWGISAEKILVFPNGVDVQRFNPNPSTRAEIRTSLGIQDNPMALFVGNFYEWHDVKTLLAAFAKVIPSHPDARLVLVGDGDRRQAMEQYAAELGLEHAVKFTGLVPHATVPSLMNAADIAIAPVPIMERDFWLSPLKLYEYMASGTALVASKVGQIADVVQDGHNGLLVPPGEATALADMINKLISEPSLRSQLGRQAREDAVRKHSWAQYISRLEQVFDAVIAGQPVSTL